METLYRKVQFEIREKDHDETVLIGKSANIVFNPNTSHGEELSDFLSGCEEIPDPTAQLQADNTQNCEAGCKVYTGGERRHDKHCVFYPESFTKMYDELQADKAEILEALENLTEYGSTGEDAVEMKREIKSLIQKHKL